MKSYKIVACAALIGVFGASNAITFDEFDSWKPVLQAFGLKKVAEMSTDSCSFSDDGKIVLKSLVRLNSYAYHYQSKENGDNAFVWWDICSDQIGYFVTDAAISYSLDQISKRDFSKQLMQAKSVQYISNTISPETNQFLKDQAIMIVSAWFINNNTVYKSSRRTDRLGMHHNQVIVKHDRFCDKGFVKTAAGNFTVASANHFVIEPYLKKCVADCSDLNPIKNYVADETIVDLATVAVNYAAITVLPYILDLVV